MRESSNVMRFVFIGLAAMAFIAGFLYKEGALGKKPRARRDIPHIKIDSYIKPIDPAKIGYRELPHFELELKNASAMAVGKKGNIYIGGESGFALLDSSGKHMLLTDLSRPVKSIAVSPGGTIFIGDTDRVRVLDKNGRESSSWEPFSDVAFITSIAATDEYLFAADARNRVIWRYTHDGTVSGTIGKKDKAAGIKGFFIPGPFFDIATAYEEELWAVNPGRHALENYTLDGRLQTSWSKSSIDIDGFCGCCNPTHFALMPDGAFITAEKGIPRVKIHEPSGALRTVVAGSNLFVEGTLIAVRIFVKKEKEAGN